MLNKKGTYALLDKYHFAYEMHEHPAAYTIEELDTLDIPHKDLIVKNLFLRDDKKQKYYLVTVQGHKTVHLKALSQKIRSRKLSFASEEDLKTLLGLEKGHVTPLGVLNDQQKKVIVVIDCSLQGQRIGIHPMENTATVFLLLADVMALIAAHGHEVVMCDFDSL